MERLHQKSWYALWQHMLKEATDDVGKLDRRIFSDPALGGALQKIADKYSVEVATIQPGTSASRRVVEKESNDGWGGRAQFKQTWLDVSIPFHRRGRVVSDFPFVMQHPIPTCEDWRQRTDDQRHRR